MINYSEYISGSLWLQQLVGLFPLLKDESSLCMNGTVHKLCMFLSVEWLYSLTVSRDTIRLGIGIFLDAVGQL